LEYFGLFAQKIVIGHSWIYMLELFYHSQISEQMYFLLSLFLIRILAFVWYRMIFFHAWIVALLWAGYILFISIFSTQIFGLFQAHLDPFLHAIIGLKFYLLGLVLFNWQSVFLRRSLWAIGITLFLTIFLKFATSFTFLTQLSYLLCLYFLFLGFFREHNILSNWGRFTMGIYLLHVPIVLKALSLITLRCHLGGLVGFIIVALAGFFISLVAAKLLDQTLVWRFALGEAPDRIRNKG
jgi:hypothetical protein